MPSFPRLGKKESKEKSRGRNLGLLHDQIKPWLGRRSPNCFMLDLLMLK